MKMTTASLSVSVNLGLELRFELARKMKTIKTCRVSLSISIKLGLELALGR